MQVGEQYKIRCPRAGCSGYPIVRVTNVDETGFVGFEVVKPCAGVLLENMKYSINQYNDIQRQLVEIVEREKSRLQA